MKHDPDNHHRRSIRLKRYDYSEAGAYFVTICTQRRECLFGDIVDGEMQLNDAGQMVRNAWKILPVRFSEIETDEFIIMSNHIHGIIIINNTVGAIHELPLQIEPKQRRKMLLPKIIGFLKMNSAKQVNQIYNTPGRPVWQRNYYEHIIRDEEELHRIRTYIIENPAKWVEDEDNPWNITQQCRGGSRTAPTNIQL